MKEEEGGGGCEGVGMAEVVSVGPSFELFVTCLFTSISSSVSFMSVTGVVVSIESCS